MDHLSPRHARARLATALSVLLVATGCATSAATDPETLEASTPAAASSTPSAEDPPAEDTFPVTVGSGDTAIEIPERPEAIVSLSPTATEVLFAIGAGGQVVAVDDQSDHPPAAPTTDLSGYQPNVEAIAAYEPDLVVAAGDPGDLVASLATLDVPVLLHPSATTLEEAYTQIEQAGVATGHVAEAAELVASMQSEIQAIVDQADVTDRDLTYYHELDPSHYTVTSSTFIGQVYELFGLTSIADAAEDANGGYPQLSPEYIIEADPDLVFLADGECCDVTAEQVVSRPGWEAITAVEQGAIVTLDEDLASRWGPRVVEFVRTIADAVTASAPAA